MRKRAWLWTPVLTMLLWFPAAPAIPDTSSDTIEDQTLRYALSYRNRNAGQIEITIRNENGGYVITSTGKPSALASLFVKAHISDTRFVRRSGVVALDRGAESLVGDKGYQRSFHFDHDRRRIEFSSGESSAIQVGDQFEAAAFPLLLMLRPLENIAGARVREVSFKRIREYTYEAPVEEVVTVPAGEFSSWKINRHRSDRPADTVTVWLNKTGTPIPLKIAVSKKGNLSILTLSGHQAGG